jgi:multisubunit Na+/H+ antiporter MnhB subunit
MAAFDVLLACLLFGLAARLLVTTDLFETITLFVSFGLGLALVWVRIGAIDVALAEVALGTGVTGALLINTRRRLENKAPEWLEVTKYSPAAALLPALVGVVAGGAALAAFVFRLRAAAAPGFADHRPAELPVQNPVTAVLLDFRAYDTLLEVAVLLAGVVAVWSLERGRPAVPAPASAAEEPVLAELVRWIVPMAVIAAVYLTWVGSYAPGGAFQAGALLAGATVLMLAAGFLRPYTSGSAVLRGAVAAGLFVFTGAALVTAAMHGAMLRWPHDSAYWWIISVEAVLTISIAAILAELFVDVPAARGRQ